MQRYCGFLTPRAVLLLLLTALTGGFTGGCERTTRDTDIKLISVGEVKHLIDQQGRGNRDVVILIDPRPQKYYDQARLPGARHLILPDVPVRATTDPSITRYSNIVVYGDDPASATARGMVKRMMAVGYRGVRLFAGGVKEWTGRGYQTEGTGLPPAAEPAPEPGPETPATEGSGTEPTPGTPAPPS
jgi:3-mercaptopyruvate sulfurtransferase SseA